MVGVNARKQSNSPKATKVARRIALPFVGKAGTPFVIEPLVDMLNVSFLLEPTTRRMKRQAGGEGGSTELK